MVVSIWYFNANNDAKVVPAGFELPTQIVDGSWKNQDNKNRALGGKQIVGIRHDSNLLRNVRPIISDTRGPPHNSLSSK